MLLGTSEIKIALLGNVSAGKTTVLNALFKQKYGEVSMKRTTAGVNYFRICAPGTGAPADGKKEEMTKADDDGSKEPVNEKKEEPAGCKKEDSQEPNVGNGANAVSPQTEGYGAQAPDCQKEEEMIGDEKPKSCTKDDSKEPIDGRKDDNVGSGANAGGAEDGGTPWFPHTDEPRSAKSTLEEITTDNRELRESVDVQEKWFDIALTENLVEMRKGTQLVVVDIPGINEAGACSKYKDYVIEKWDTFDCLVLVMDGRQGVNTEDQVFLLNLVENNSKRREEVPIIVLFNKVDDPSDKEQAELVLEAREELARTFGSVNFVVDPEEESNPFMSPPKAGTPSQKSDGDKTESSSFAAPQSSFPASTFGTSGAMATATTSDAPAQTPFGSGSSGPFSFGRSGATGTSSNAPVPTPFGSGSSGPFSFGASATGTTSNASAPAPFGSSSSGPFSFGTSTTTARNAAVPTPFGSGSSGPFSFGASATGTTSNASVPAPFGSGSSGPFSFGTSTTTTSNAPAPTPSFGFGSTAGKAPGLMLPTPAPSVSNTSAALSFGSPGGFRSTNAADGHFGSKDWRWSASVATTGGTKSTPYQPTPRQVETSTGTILFQTISAMPVYEHKSIEELRYEDYLQANNGTGNGTATRGSSSEVYGTGKRTTRQGTVVESLASLSLSPVPASCLSTKRMRAKSRKVKPSFVPVSAMYAFIHQSASSMSLDQFKSFFDKDLIEKVGRFQLGQRRWNKLTEDERILETYDILSDSLIHTESLKNSNFDEFLTLLNQTIGGETAQRKLIEGQIRRSLQSLKDGKYNAQTMIRCMGGSEVMLSDCIESAAAKTHALLGGDAVKRIVPDLIDSFCESYQSLEDAAFANLEQDGPGSINVLALPMVELISCHKIGSKLDLGDLGQCAEARMKVLFRRQLDVLLCQSSQKIPTFGAALNRNQRWDLSV
ncbi:Nuclear protein 96 (Partial), partial [Seminavis robusta]|eukprot:Sro2614_g332670.1 Nuclear protein 96 (942) ;mRNA; f:10180-13101